MSLRVKLDMRTGDWISCFPPPPKDLNRYMEAGHIWESWIAESMQGEMGKYLLLQSGFTDPIASSLNCFALFF